MSQKEKLLKKIKNSPRNVRIEELVRLMEYYGFVAKLSSKEGYFFTTPKLVGKILPRSAPIPHGRENKVLRVYVEKCLEAINMINEEK
ncbi:MAG: hypothetical protein WCQ99_07820 [Pseudomonadota bacterium]